MERINTHRIFTVIIYALLVIFTITFMSGCSGKDGRDGVDGKDGSSCSVEQVSNGAIITCQDNTTALILNGEKGEDGLNAPPTAFTVVELIDPCGDNPDHFDEVLFRLANGQLIAHFSQNSLQFLTVIGPGNYRTTDAQSCHFTVTSDLSVVW